ncbi:MAG TPA: tripartite tricarboxylate transporter substrate binding protein [Usitatibacter sp.]|nr:tripartite tricarboxylate transporter substrate binding protein [Usitatibacter sp.]
MRIASSAAALALGLALSATAMAQSWPQRTVKFVVPFAAGGATDVSARVLGERLSDMWKQPVIIENRVGAGGSIGAAEAARANPDGYTLFFPSGSVMTANQHIYRNMKYDPDKDFVPVTKVVSAPQVLVVNAASPFKTVKDLIDAAKAKPSTLTFGHAGTGSQTHLAGESFNDAAKIDVISVPYKGDPPALNDLLGGSLSYCVTTLSSAIPHVQAGRLRALGVTSAEPAEQLPGVPPIAATLPGFDNKGWFGIVAPAGTPNEIVQKVYRDTKKALDDPAFRARFAAMGLTTIGDTPEEMARAMKVESERYAAVAKARKLKVN